MPITAGNSREFVDSIRFPNTAANTQFNSSRGVVRIIGAGPVGSLLALNLADDNYEVHLYEKRADPSRHSARSQNSIGLTLTERGLKPLDSVGLRDEVLANAIPLASRIVHRGCGDMVCQPYGRERHELLYSVERNTLWSILVRRAAEHPGITIHFEHEVVSVDTTKTTCVVRNVSAGKTVTLQADIIIGADGATSKVRSELQARSGFNFAQSFLPHGFTELKIPKDCDCGLSKDGLHVWPRGDCVLVGLPNTAGTVTLSLFAPRERIASFTNLGEIESFLQRNFPDLSECIPCFAEQILNGKSGALVTIRCDPWFRGNTALIGDAAHAIVPFLGQGVNAGLADCIVMRDCLRCYAPNYEWAFAEFQHRRKRNVDALADLALAHYEELGTACTKRFRCDRLVEKILAGLFPQIFRPLYARICFETGTPYAEALHQHRRNVRVFRFAMMTAAFAGLILSLLL